MVDRLDEKSTYDFLKFLIDSASSLKQRLGRSDRKADSHHMLKLYPTNEDSLLQSLVGWNLIWKDGASLQKGMLSLMISFSSKLFQFVPKRTVSPQKT
ncbi:hypothetical protein HNR44_003045 [Geomicrobium halophilum]|uniref:Uncharacterized protein n=1 Tax=Geomicrobium halophilum TaxID=549000 RepID=A0A841PWW9_9BACL|nr:hypothetical protein [Geomicrobium halophilum]